MSSVLIPPRLGDDSHSEPVRHQPPPEERGTERRMVDVRVPRHQENIQVLPIPAVPFGAGHRQERGLRGTRIRMHHEESLRSRAGSRPLLSYHKRAWEGE